MFEGQKPEAVLERIQVGHDIWCLVKFPKPASEAFLSIFSKLMDSSLDDEDDDDEDDDFHDNSCIWLSQDELIEHVNSIGCTLDLPPFSLPFTQASELVLFLEFHKPQRNQLQSLQQSYEKLEEEYKKFRVETEVMLWNKNSQITSVGFPGFPD